MIVSTLNLIAGLGWEPEIRGALTVALASAVLMGSIWMILVTNTGIRLGSLIALAGFFGWMMIMGVIWWIYGIGYVGSLPSWEVHEVNADAAGYEADGIQQAVLGNVGDLPDTNCFPDQAPFPPSDMSILGPSSVATRTGCTPRAIDLLLAFPGAQREQVLQELLNPQLDESKINYMQTVEQMTDADTIFSELIHRSEDEVRAGVVARNDIIGAADPNDPRFLSASELEKELDSLITRRDTRVNALTLSALGAVGPEIIDWGVDQGFVELNDWRLLTTAESGEAVATAQAGIAEEGVFDGHEFIVLDSFQQGGKPLREGDSILDRIWYKITSTARITHPTNYAVVQTQVAIEQVAEPGELPPLPQVEPEAATVSVVMIRNLGNLRLIPALLTLVSALLFFASCLALHYRDLELTRRLAAPAAG